MGRHSALVPELLPEDEGDVAIYRDLFDPDVTSVKAFVNSFKIQVKERYRLPNGRMTSLIDFRLNYAQEQLYDTVLQDWADGHGSSIVYDKGRQDGITTGVQFLMFERAHRGGPGYGIAISRKNEQNAVAFRLLRDFVRQIPKDMYQLALGGRVIATNTTQFEIEWNAGGRTLIRCVTSRDASIGHGDANSWIAADEYAHWPFNKDALNEAWASWLNVPGAFRFVFSTAKGREQFQRRFEEARKGVGGWHAIFGSWLRNPRKTLPFACAEDRTAFIHSIGLEADFGQDDEMNLVAVHKATPEQLHWRRQTIASDHNGDIITFKRLHPTTAEESFLTADSQFFPLVALEAQAPAGQEMDRLARRGTLSLENEVSLSRGGVSDKAEANFHEERTGHWGPWRIFCPPVPGVAYAFGADPAEGRAVQADGKHEADFATIEIREILTKRIVAQFRAHMDPARFAYEVVKASIWYGRAKGYVEENNHGGLVIDRIAETHEMAEILLTRKRMQQTDSGKTWTLAMGFKASRQTKHKSALISKEWVQSLPRPKPGEPGNIPYSLIEEMQRCEQDEDGWFLGAGTGHDDLVSAMRLCLSAIDVMEQFTNLWSPVQPRLPDHEKAIMRMSELEMAANPSGATDPDLPGF